MVASQCFVLTLKWTRRTHGQLLHLHQGTGLKSGYEALGVIALRCCRTDQDTSSTAVQEVLWASPSQWSSVMEHAWVKTTQRKVLVQPSDSSGVSVELSPWHLSSVAVLVNVIRGASKYDSEDKWLRSISLIVLWTYILQRSMCCGMMNLAVRLLHYFKSCNKLLACRLPCLSSGEAGVFCFILSGLWN